MLYLILLSYFREFSSHLATFSSKKNRLMLNRILLKFLFISKSFVYFDLYIKIDRLPSYFCSLLDAILLNILVNKYNTIINIIQYNFEICFLKLYCICVYWNQRKINLWEMMQIMSIFLYFISDVLHVETIIVIAFILAIFFIIVNTGPWRVPQCTIH